MWSSLRAEVSSGDYRPPGDALGGEPMGGGPGGGGGEGPSSPSSPPSMGAMHSMSIGDGNGPYDGVTPSQGGGTGATGGAGGAGGTSQPLGRKPPF